MKKKIIIISSIFVFLLNACSNKEKEFQQLKETEQNSAVSEKALTEYKLYIGNIVSGSMGLDTGKVDLGNWRHYGFRLDNVGEYNSNAIKIVRQNIDYSHDFVDYRIVRIKDISLFNNIVTKTNGKYTLPHNTMPNASTEGALDFIRHQGVLKSIGGTKWRNVQEIMVGLRIPKFDSLFTNATKVYVLGLPKQGGLGCVNQNQGETFTYLNMNGLWQDGAVIVQKWEIVRWNKVWNPFLKRYTYQPIYGNIYYLLMTRIPTQKNFTDVFGKGIEPVVNHFANVTSEPNGYGTWGPYYGQIQVELTNCTGKPNLYVKAGGYPTYLNYNYCSENATGDEFIRAYGTSGFYVRVFADGVYSTYTMKISTANSL